MPSNDLTEKKSDSTEKKLSDDAAKPVDATSTAPTTKKRQDKDDGDEMSEEDKKLKESLELLVTIITEQTENGNEVSHRNNTLRRSVCVDRNVRLNRKHDHVDNMHLISLVVIFSSLYICIYLSLNLCRRRVME